MEAVALVEAATASKLINLVTFSEAIASCEHSGAHQQALVLLKQMERLALSREKTQLALHLRFWHMACFKSSGCWLQSIFLG